MRPIPNKLRAEMAADPYYQRCAITGRPKGAVKIEWHHNLIYAGRQVNEKWCILPISEAIHIRARERDMKEKLDWVMLNRGTDEELQRYSKVENLIARRAKLNEKYGNPKGGPNLSQMEDRSDARR